MVARSEEALVFLYHRICFPCVDITARGLYAFKEAGDLGQDLGSVASDAVHGGSVHASERSLAQDSPHPETSIGREVSALINDRVISFRFEEYGEHGSCHAYSDDADFGRRHCVL